MDLMRQSGESLAGRIGQLSLDPLDIRETGSEDPMRLWIRGGFPRSFLAAGDSASTLWRQNFIRTYLERDIPMLGPRIPAETLRRFWTMLAHSQGGLWNASVLARSLAVDGKTVTRYLDLLVDLLLVRRLPPFHARQLRVALDDIKPERAFVVYGGTERYPLPGGVEAIGLAEMASVL